MLTHRHMYVCISSYMRACIWTFFCEVVNFRNSLLLKNNSIKTTIMRSLYMCAFTHASILLCMDGYVHGIRQTSPSPFQKQNISKINCYTPSFLSRTGEKKGVFKSWSSHCKRSSLLSPCWCELKVHSEVSFL